MPTLFERIIAGEIPANIVHRDDRVIAFRDIRPRAPTHILVVPNKPIPTANDIADEDEALVGHMFTVARDLAKKEGIAKNGYRLIINLHLIGGRPLGPMVLE
jgi:histidine triad (HIT) family protein